MVPVAVDHVQAVVHPDADDHGGDEDVHEVQVEAEHDHDTEHRVQHSVRGPGGFR